MTEPKIYAKRLIKGSSITFTALAIAGVLGILLRMFLTRSLSVYDYGLFFLVFTSISFLAIFRDLGLNIALPKFIPEFMLKNQFDSVKSSMAVAVIFQTAIMLPISIILVIFSDQISLAITGTISASLLIKVLSCWLYLMIFFHVFRYAFQGFQDTIPYAIMEVLYIAVILALTVYLIGVLQLGIIGVAIAYLASIPILVSIWLIITWKRHPKVFRGKISIEQSLVRKMFEFALPIFLGSLGGVILTYTDTIMIGLIRGPMDVGLYQAAQPISIMISYFPAALGIVLLPIASEIWAKREKALLSKAVRSIIKFSLLVIIPAVFVFMSFPEIVLRVFFGPEYILAAVTLQILTAAMIAGALFSILQCIATGIGQPIITTKTVGIMAVTNVILNLLFIPVYGIAGAAIATFLSGLLGVIILSRFLKKSIEFIIPTSSLFKTIAAGISMLIFIMGLKSLISISPWWLEAITVIVPGLLLYTEIILLTKTVDREDVQLLKGIMPIPKKITAVIEKYSN